MHVFSDFKLVTCITIQTDPRLLSQGQRVGGGEHDVRDPDVRPGGSRSYHRDLRLPESLPNV